jgi:putative membrane protein
MLANLKKYQWQLSVALLLIFNGVGLFGVLLSDEPKEFLLLTPINLMISAVILFANHCKWSKNQVYVLIAVGIGGFLMEVIGVKTGVVFGEYFYEETLGPKLFDVPIIIGLNWALLSYFAVYTFDKFIDHKLLLTFISSLFLVILDVIIEPIAIKYDFWQWKSEEIPLQNFIAWWLLAFIFCLSIAYVKKGSQNKLAVYLLLIQVMFFGILNLVK